MFAVIILIKYSYQSELVLIALVFSSYIALSLILRVLKMKFSFILLMLNDYLFIGFIIWNSGVLDLLTYSYLIFPILNSRNNIGKKNAIVLYLIPLVLIFFLQSKVDISFFIVFLFFWIINSFDNIKNHFQNFYNQLNTTLDDFLVKENSLDQIHKIYEDIIPLFNSYSLFTKPIQDILCFEISDRNFQIINGSRFFYNIEFESNNIILENNNKIFKNLRITLNNDDINENIILRIKQETFEYVFVFIPKQADGVNSIETDFFYKLLFPFFSRLSHIFNFKKLQFNENRRNFNDIAKKVTYVNNAISSMHFTRNKLSPFTVYLSMMEDYISETDEMQKKRIEPYLKIERKKLKTSLEEILDRANIILEKSNNPFNVLVSKEELFSNLLVKVRESSSYYLRGKNFEFSIEITNPDWAKKIKINDIGIDLVLSNWFSNVNKYKNHEYYGVSVNENELHFTLTFYNSFVAKNEIGEPQFVKDFNSDDRMAILKRNTHGLIEIKDFLDQMNIESFMYTKGAILFFEINFLKIKL